MRDTFQNPIITAETLRIEFPGKYWYLASPYSHPEEGMRYSRAIQIMEISGILMQKGLVVYSPIWACHEVARRMSLPGDFKFWENMNDTMLKPAVGVIVAEMNGWTESEGVRNEIHKALMMDKPVYYYDPGSDTFSD